MSVALAMNSAGLLLDIIGVVVLFRHGLPPNAVAVGKDRILTDKLATGVVAARRTALGLILLGFILQGVAAWLR